jgi:hypothetical protein
VPSVLIFGTIVLMPADQITKKYFAGHRSITQYSWWMFDEPLVIPGLGQFSISQYRPCYDVNSELAKELSGIARHLLVFLAVRRIPRLLKYPDRNLSMEEIAAFDFGDDGPDWLTDVLRNPNYSALRQAIDNFLECIFNADGDEAALAAKAIGLRYKWSEWTAVKTAALCVIMADEVFQLECTEPTTITAERLWKRALSIFRELCEDARKAAPRNGSLPSSPPAIENSEHKTVDRSRLFRELGIKMVFEPPIERMNSSPVPPSPQHLRFLIRVRNCPVKIPRILADIKRILGKRLSIVWRPSSKPSGRAHCERSTISGDATLSDDAKTRALQSP